ncbi:hypothetical protein ACFLR7_02195 [Acidobacteriota bacterium]
MRTTVRAAITAAISACVIVFCPGQPQAGNSLPTLGYTVRPDLDGGAAALRIEMSFRGGLSGSTRLMLPSSWAGNQNLHEGIEGLRALSEGTEIRDTDKPHIKQVSHAPSAEIRLVFTARQRWEGEISGERFQKYWPSITHDYFQFYGMVLFPFPSGYASGEIRIRLLWDGFPKSWAFCNSFGSGSREQVFTGSLNRLRRAVYAGGDYRLRELRIHNSPVTLALRGSSWKFTDPEFFSFAEKIISAEREFWQDHDFPYFLIILAPFGTGHTNMGGTGLFQSFSVFNPSDTGLDLRFKRLFAHELFHSWNATRLGALKNPAPELYWFSEGFTDYYTRLLLLRSDLASLEDYVRDLNQKIRKYMTSPVRNAPLREAAAGYHTDDRLGDLSYQRGDFLALRWNTLIKNATEGRHSLDDLMRGLFASAREGRQVITAGFICERIRELCGEDVEPDIRKYIREGGTLAFDGGELGPCFELGYITKEPDSKGGAPLRIPQFRLKKGSAFTQPDCLDWFR